MVSLAMAELIESSSSGSFNFDVFLSFRGEDTRKNFTGFLYKALKNRAINVFIDNEDLCTGEAISPKLLKAIQGSKISIPVFSKGYATSKWCLLELSHIVRCHKAEGQRVIPIFLDVEPTDVQNQTGSFAGPFEEHKKNFEPDTINSWREALRVVGNLKGLVLKDDANGDQSELVELVVKKVFDELMIGNTLLDECKYPVGIDSHIENLSPLLDIGSSDVQFIGICGLGGIGKTTIAKAIYNRFYLNFKKYSFLSDVREATKSKGLASLQKQLLIDILGTKEIHISNYHVGKKIIKERLCEKKVFLVLDDVDSQEQVDALAGELKWFGPGSRIIITARDEHILNVAKVKQGKIYKPKVLNYMDSLRLFSFHAFSMDQPPEDYMQFSHDVAHSSGGLPLTLKVLGSNLSDEREKDVWDRILKEWKKFPSNEVHGRLKISYDNLDEHQKAIFLDVACLFVGWEKETVYSIWEACDYYPQLIIDRLIKRSLLEFDNKYDKLGNLIHCLKMHDQIQDMGRKILLQKSWSDGDISQVLKGCRRTDSMVEGMILPSDISEVYLNSKPFKMMSNLRFLDLRSVNFKGELSDLPSELRWLRWKTCSRDILSTNFYHERLVYLNLSESSIKQAWNFRPRNKWFQNLRRFQNLKVLMLDSCKSLSMSPNFSWFPYLEELYLRSCSSLRKLDESIGQLSKLEILNLSSCEEMKELPKSIGQLSKLKILNLSCCKEMKELPKSIGQLSKLKILNLSCCKEMEELPKSIGKLTSLIEIHLGDSGIKELSDGVGLLEKLQILDAENHFHGKITKLPISMGKMSCLSRLRLHGNMISKFPNDFSMLKNLKELEISTSSRLVLSESSSSSKFLDRDKWDKRMEYQLPELPSSLVRLSCRYCKSLVRLPDLSRLKNLRMLSLNGCDKLEEIGSLEGTESLEELDARGRNNLTQTPWKTQGQGTLLSNSSRQNRYSLTAMDGIDNKELILCLVLEFPFLSYFKEYSNSKSFSVSLEIVAYIWQKDRRTRCFHQLEIDDIKRPINGDTIYIHHFKGFDWFGISLQGKDAIEILAIHDPESPHHGTVVKFWKVLIENREPDRQELNQDSSAMMVADFFTWSYVKPKSTRKVPSLTSESLQESNQLQENGILLTVVNQILELFRRIRQFFGLS